MSRLHGVILVAAIFFASTGPVLAQNEGFGAGAAVGVTNEAASQNPIGLSVKGWLSDRHAVAGLTSFVIAEEEDSYWVLQSDYLFHNFETVDVDEGLFALYLGAGGQLTIKEERDNQFAFRGPIGVTYLFDSAPIDLFVEVAPTVSVTDPSSFRFDGAIGFRFYPSFGGDASSD